MIYPQWCLEGLAGARRRHARQLVDALAPHRVHVVLTVRDLARLLTSAWQQSVVMGRGEDWPEYLASVRDPEHGTISVATKFWLKHDITRVLDVWGTVVPHDRVIVVTVPPPVISLHKKALATTVEIRGASHVVMISHPQETERLILRAARRGG